jgi:Tfp pilus assembly protein PilN
LKHRWPTSQLLAALARDLPAEVTLGGFDIADETSAATPDPHASATRTKEAAPPGTSQDGTPFQRDLERLRSEYDSRQQFIELRGVTTDDAHLHAYLLKLGEHPLIVSAQLQSITVVPAAKGPSTSRFVARLLVRPGYGQPRGPDVTEKAKKDKPAEKTEQSVSAATPEAQS